jgi:hypothetical protein
MTKETFTLASLTAPGLTQAEVLTLLSPLTKVLDKLKMPYVLVPTYFNNFYDHFAASFGPLPMGSIPIADMISSRLIPRSTLAEHPAGISRALRDAVDSGHFYVALSAMNLKATPGAPAKAVLPAWRSTIAQCIVGEPWNWSIPHTEMVARKSELLDDVMPKLDAATPGSGIYLNEAHAEQTNWQTEFYGENYGRLLGIKKRYDPDSLFYAATSVGSDAWKLDGDGRPCRAETNGSSKGAATIRGVDVSDPAHGREL